MVKNPPANVGDSGAAGLIPGWGRSPVGGVKLPFLVAHTVKHLPTMWETWLQSLGREDLQEKEMATHFSIVAWKIPGRRILAGYSPWGRKESDMTERLHFHFHFRV